MSAANGWIGVDLDGTLAFHYRGQYVPTRIGPPIEPMLERVREWLSVGIEVRIVTARAADLGAIPAIQAWCEHHGLGRLKVTNKKDGQMIQLWDDRAVTVEFNTGRVLTIPSEQSEDFL